MAAVAVGAALLAVGLFGKYTVLYWESPPETVSEWGLVEAVTYGGIEQVVPAGEGAAVHPAGPGQGGPRAKKKCPT